MYLDCMQVICLIQLVRSFVTTAEPENLKREVLEQRKLSAAVSNKFNYRTV